MSSAETRLWKPTEIILTGARPLPWYRQFVPAPHTHAFNLSTHFAHCQGKADVGK